MQTIKQNLQSDVDSLTSQLAAAEFELSTARERYHTAEAESNHTGIVPSDRRWRKASDVVDQLRRRLSEHRERLAQAISEDNAAQRFAAVRSAGSPLAPLVAVAEAKLAAFTAAAAALRQVEADLYAVLFAGTTGLKQSFRDPQIAKDAEFARARLRGLAIRAARQSNCRVDARFETDGNVHLGEPEASAFYTAAK